MNSNTEIWDEFAPLVPENTLMIAVEAPLKTDVNKYRWYDINVSKKPFVSNVDQMIKTIARLLKFIDNLKLQYNFDSKNVVLAGFSQGAILSLNVALSNPDSVNFVGVFSGMLPGKIEDRTTNNTNELSVFLTHGSLDKGIDISDAKKIKSFLDQKNINVKMTVEEIDHSITAKQFQDFINWYKAKNLSE